MKMNPSESVLHADLILSLDDKSWLNNQEAVKTLKSGDHIQFEATFLTAGNEHRLHHLHLSKLEKIEGSMEISEHI